MAMPTTTRKLAAIMHAIVLAEAGQAGLLALSGTLP